MLCNMNMPDMTFPASWLSEAESARLHAISRPEHAHFYLQSRGLLRTVLGHLTGQLPEKVTFAALPHGKPQLVGNNLQFNLSHNQHWLAIAIAKSPVGIDIEFSENTRQRAWLAVAGRFFTKEEFRYLGALPEEDLRAAFFRFWTQKEAILKAHGAGLNAGLYKLDLLSALHSLDQQIYYSEYSNPIPQLHCAISTQNVIKTPVAYYILKEQLEIQPLMPPYISHLCLKPNSL